MNRGAYIAVAIIASIALLSCRKLPFSNSEGEPQWIKVLADSAAHFPGKIRADEQNNLLCSYNYENYRPDSISAIVKIDAQGNFVWRREFTDLIIYDFAVTPEGDAIIVSNRNDSITLTNLSGNNASTFIGAYSFPLDASKIRSIDAMQILRLSSSGDYVISGSLLYKANNQRRYLAFIMGVSASNYGKMWMDTFSFPTSTSQYRTLVTGCAPATDGYLLFGNTEYATPFVSSFFLLKLKEQGSFSWITTDTTSWYHTDGTYSGYYCNTSNIIAGNDGNFYACAFNNLYNLPALSKDAIYTEDPATDSARIFRIHPNGDMDTTKLKYAYENRAADLVQTADNGLLVVFNSFVLGGVYYIGEQHSFIASINSDFNVESISNLQTHYMDYAGSICPTPDGHYAIESIIQSFGNENYRLEVIKTDENGNF